MWSPIGRRRCGCGATSYDFAVTATTIAHPARPRQDVAADPGPSRPQAPAALPCATARMRRPLRRYPTRGWQSIRRRWPRRRLSTECAGPRVVVGWAAKAPRRTGSNHRPVVSAGAIVTGVAPGRVAAQSAIRAATDMLTVVRRLLRVVCGWLPPLIRWRRPNAVACATTSDTNMPTRAARKRLTTLPAVRPAPAVRYWRRCRRCGRCRPLRAASGRLSRTGGHTGSSWAAKSRRTA